MNNFSFPKRWLSYVLLLSATACLQQEIRPEIDKDTRGCLLRQKDDYSVTGMNAWQLSSQLFEYNIDGNPIRIRYIDSRRKITKIITMEYEGLRLRQVNLFEGDREIPANRTAYKLLDVGSDFSVIIEHTFKRKADLTFEESHTFAHEFFRTGDGSLKLRHTEFVTPEATPDQIGKRLGIYWRLEYDSDTINVFRRIYKFPDSPDEQIQYTLSGFDLNGRTPYNANLWLSYTTNFGVDFMTGDGYWSVNNIALLAPGSNPPLFFFSYELNQEGFPCMAYTTRADNAPDIGKAFFYYYNCPCQR